MARSIRDKEAIANLLKFVCSQINESWFNYSIIWSGCRIVCLPFLWRGYEQHPVYKLLLQYALIGKSSLNLISHY